MDVSGEMLGRLMEILLPSNGRCLFLVEVYFDESGTHGDSPVMCVAGYLFTKDQCRKLDQEWLAVLEKHHLPHFHMMSCAHGTGVFKGRSKDERIEVETSMINIIKRRAERGIAATITESEYLRVVPKAHRDIAGSAYTWCIHMCLQGVAEWLEKYQPSSLVSYFFESGHRHQKEANDTLTNVFMVPQLRAKYCYASHTFATKIPDPPGNPCVRPLQAADLLAWQVRKFKSDRKRPPKMDFMSLVESPHYFFEGSGRRLEEISAVVMHGRSPAPGS
jgi:hypothetical protein